MSRVEVERTVRRSPEDVFDFVARGYFVNHQLWDPTVRRIGQMGAGPVTVGTTGWLVRKGSRQIERIEVVVFEEGRRFRTVSNLAVFRLSMDCSIEPLGAESARVTLRAVLTAPRLIGLAARPASVVLRRQMLRNLDRMRALLESRPDDSLEA